MGEALISKRRHIGLKVETVKGTTPTGGSAFATADYALIAYDIQATTQFGRFDRDTQKAYLNQTPRFGRNDWLPNFVYRGSTAYGQHDHGRCLGTRATRLRLRACVERLEAVIQRGRPKTLSIRVALGAAGLSDAVIFKARGCAGTVTFEGRVGQPLLARFTFTGIYDGVETGTLEVPTQEGAIPGVFQGGLGQRAGGTTFSPVLSTINLDIGNTVVMRESVNDASGFLHAVITDRRPTGSIDPDLELGGIQRFLRRIAKQYR
jgi:hypothetical protein